MTNLETYIEFITGSNNDTGSAETCQENLGVSLEANVEEISVGSFSENEENEEQLNLFSVQQIDDICSEAEKMVNDVQEIFQPKCIVLFKDIERRVIEEKLPDVDSEGENGVNDVEDQDGDMEIQNEEESLIHTGNIDEEMRGGVVDEVDRDHLDDDVAQPQSRKRKSSSKIEKIMHEK